MERHLAAFEPALEAETGARLRTFRAAAGRLAVARSRASADALAWVFGALRRTQIVQRHVSPLFRDVDQMTNLQHQAARRRRVDDADRMADPAKTKAAQRQLLFRVERRAP